MPHKNNGDSRQTVEQSFITGRQAVTEKQFDLVNELVTIMTQGEFVSALLPFYPASYFDKNTKCL
jgi:hypothetical protein